MNTCKFNHSLDNLNAFEINLNHSFHIKTNFEEIIDRTASFIATYLIGLISLSGIYINLSCLVHIGQRMNTQTCYYRYLWITRFANVFVCLVGVGYMNSYCLNCIETYQNSYMLLFYKWYVINIPFRVIYFVGIASENILILTRCLIFYAKKDPLKKISLLKINIFIYLFAILTMLPLYFAFDFIPSENGYIWQPSKFGKSFFSKVFLLGVFLIDTVIPLVTLSIVNILAMLKFYSIMKMKRLLVAGDRSNETRRAEIRYSKKVLFLGSVYYLARVLDVSLGVYSRLLIYKNIYMTSEMKSVINLARQLSFLIVGLDCVFSGIIFCVELVNNST